MKVALLYPEVYDMARFKEHRKEFPPFGVLYLAAVIEQAGHNVSIKKVTPHATYPTGGRDSRRERSPHGRSCGGGRGRAGAALRYRPGITGTGQTCRAGDRTGQGCTAAIGQG